MKKITIYLILAVLVLSLSILTIHAEEKEVVLDPKELGVKFIGTNATSEDYIGPGVVNLRCAHSSWDSAKEYLWLVSNWPEKPKEPASLLIGELDMSTVKKISFYYVTDGGNDMTNNRVSFAKDAEGKEIVARAQITEATAPLKNPNSMEIEILDNSYKGDVYIYIEYSARMFVGNFTLSIDDTPPESEPETLPPETEMETENPETFDSSVVFMFVIVVSLGTLVLRKREGYGL